MARHLNGDVIGRVRAHLLRRDWDRAARRELDRALRDITVLERRLRKAGARVAPAPTPSLSASVVELRRTLVKIRHDRGGGFHRAASLL